MWKEMKLIDWDLSSDVEEVRRDKENDEVDKW